MNWTPWKRKFRSWARLEWVNKGGDLCHCIESDKPLSVTINDDGEQPSIWVDVDEGQTVLFFAHAAPCSINAEIDQNGSKLEVNP